MSNIWTAIKTPTREIFDLAIKTLECEGIKNDRDIKWDNATFRDGEGVVYYGSLGIGCDRGGYLSQRPSICNERVLSVVPDELFEL